VEIPDNAGFLVQLGVAYFNLKDALKARTRSQQAWALSPEDRMTGLMLSRAFAAAGNEDAAVQTLQTLRARNPLDLELIIQLGRVYEAASKPAQAYEVYRARWTSVRHCRGLLRRPHSNFRASGSLSGSRHLCGCLPSRGGTEETIAPWTRLIRRPSPDRK